MLSGSIAGLRVRPMDPSDAQAVLDIYAAGIAGGLATFETDNHASLALRAKYGFRTVGVRHRPGKLRGVWRDVVAIERRSAVAGLE